MKKQLMIGILLAVLLVFPACSSQQPDTGTTTDGASDGKPAATDTVSEEQTSEPDSAVQPADTGSNIKNADGFVFEYEGEKIYMDENMTTVLEKLGEPKNVFESPSCAFDGIDRIFIYAGMEIHTYPADEQDFVHTVNFKDDSIATPEGIYLGMDIAEMLAAYGDGYEQSLGLYTYTRGQTYLSFLIEDDMIAAITFGLNL